MDNDYMPWKILSATVNVGSMTEGWNLAESSHEMAEEPRVFQVGVLFDQCFQSAPVVNVGLTGFDIDQRHTARLSLRVVETSTVGFRAEIATWSDSRIYSVEFSWMAVGA
jgi:H-type lectin domain